ncbi:phage recombination protein Bet [Fimbriiglobus ruber]|uniref:Phage recombination protein Bet n=1 Tax=Fimbriiglobus ruber TaxID=1908690 RepID=A0A225DEV6_9BACT|nr:phage recombination protein Bet [Fimbriiglobus ruber]OWK39523.1 Phage recombination protein Bet [Fimbriiglobus ruber]
MTDITHRSYTASQLALIRRTVAKDTNQDEFDLFIEICKQQGLDPFKKQIFAQVYNKDKADKRQIVIVTSIDGYRAKAQRCGDYRPAEEETRFEADSSLKDPQCNPMGLIRAVVKVFKFGPDKVWYPVVGEARWDEFAPLDDAEFDWVDTGETWPDTGKPKKKKVARSAKKTLKEGNWKNMPHVMLGKCAEAQALRRGWPEALSGLYVQEEMDKVQLDMTATEAVEAYERDERLKRTATKETVPAIFEMTEGLQLVPLGRFADRVMEYVQSLDDVTSFDFWKDQNVRALQQYWAVASSDALQLKKDLEQHRAKLAESPLGSAA